MNGSSEKSEAVLKNFKDFLQSCILGIFNGFIYLFWCAMVENLKEISKEG